MVTLGYGALLAGLAMLGALLVVSAFAGDTLRRRLAPELGGLPGALASTLLATLTLIAIHIAPLALGILSRATVLVAAALALGASAWLRRTLPPATLRWPWSVRTPAGGGAVGRGGEPRAGGSSAGGGGAVVWVVGTVVGLVAAATALAFLDEHAAEATLSSDALNFQIPQVARWMQTGSMWQLDQFFPLYSNATYPHDGNVLLLAAILPFDHSFLARLVPVPFGVLTLVAVFACAREIGATRGWALLAALMPACLPVFLQVTLDGAQTDTPMAFATVLVILFLLRHHRTRARSDLTLAALAIGFAAATKVYAYSAFPPMVAVWLVARLVARNDRRRIAKDLGWLVLIAAVTASPWLIRNLVEAGNPLFPQKLGPFTGPRDIIREQGGFTLLHYATDPDVWRDYLRPKFAAYFAAPGYVMVGLTAVTAVVAAYRRAWPVAALGLAGVAALGAYVVTPYSAFGPEGMPVLVQASMRYAFPALLVGAIGVAWLGTRAGRRVQPVLAAAVVLALLQGLHTQWDPPAIVGGATLPLNDVLPWLAVTAVVAALLVTLPRATALVGVIVLAAVLGLVGRTYSDAPYRAYEPALNELLARAPAGARIGLAGRWPPEGISPVLPAFGPRLDNRVAFLGPFREHLLRDETDPARFRDRLAGYDYLVVGRQLSGGAAAPEEAWAEAAGFRLVVASGSLALLERPTS